MDNPKVKEFFELVDKDNYPHKIGFDSCSCGFRIVLPSSTSVPDFRCTFFREIIQGLAELKVYEPSGETDGS